MTESHLAPEQIAAIKKSIELGRTLQREYPEIARWYREGNVILEITERIDLANQNHVGLDIARVAIGLALRGHDGSFESAPYAGLIDDEKERKTLEREHIQKGYELGLGKRTLEQRAADGRKGASISYHTGLAQLTSEELSAAGQKGGKVAGKKNHEARTGMFARSPETHTENSRNAARARGLVPWISEGEIGHSRSEIEFAYQLSMNKDYLFVDGLNKGKPNMQAIVKELNKVYHNGVAVRNRKSISSALYNYIKKIEDKLFGDL